MMVDFMCQVDWATGHTDVWLDIILVMPLRMFWVRISFESVD